MRHNFINFVNFSGLTYRLVFISNYIYIYVHMCVCKYNINGIFRQVNGIEA